MNYTDIKSDGGLDPREQRRAELARADRLLTADELREKYGDNFDGGEHPKYLWWDWYQLVAQRSTRRGYWDWVEAQIEEEE